MRFCVASEPAGDARNGRVERLHRGAGGFQARAEHQSAGTLVSIAVPKPDDVGAADARISAQKRLKWSPSMLCRAA